MVTPTKYNHHNVLLDKTVKHRDVTLCDIDCILKSATFSAGRQSQAHSYQLNHKSQKFQLIVMVPMIYLAIYSNQNHMLYRT